MYCLLDILIDIHIAIQKAICHDAKMRLSSLFLRFFFAKKAGDYLSTTNTPYGLVHKKKGLMAQKKRGLPQLLAGTRVRPSRKVSFLLYSSMRMGIMSTFMPLKDKEDIGLSCYSCGRSLSVERGFFCE